MTRRERRRVAALSRRVRFLEGVLFPQGPQFAGPRLTDATLREAYEGLRSGGARFLELRVHPDLAEHAMQVSSGEEFRALSLVTRDEGLPAGGWEVVEQQNFFRRQPPNGERIVGG